MTERQTAYRAFVLGLDGVPWRLVDRWAVAGELPNFAHVLEEGVGGELESTVPATTPVAWPTIATGTGPDRHGIYGFMRVTESHSLEPYNRTALKRPPLWEMIQPAVVGNVPMTHPPAEIDGTLVTGMMTPNTESRFAHPPSLEGRIRSEIPDYRISLDWSNYSDAPETLIDDLRTLVSARRSLMRLLMDVENWRLFFFVYTAPDRLQHLFWEEDILLEHYRELDDVLGEVMDYCEERGANLFVVSDHGFGPIERTINANAVLEAEGFLNRRDRKGTSSVLDSLGITKDRVKGLVRTTGLRVKTLVERLPERVVRSVANSIPGDNVLYDIDRSRTQAFMHGHGNIYVNASDRFDSGSVNPANRDAVKDELKRTLPRVTDPETGSRILDVHDGSNLFPADEDAPDLVIEPRDGYNLRGRLADKLVVDAGSKAGSHRRKGVFAAWGPDITADGDVDGATVYDIAPTVLHALGEPLPRTRDGEPLLGIFTTDGTDDPRELPTTVYADDLEGDTDDAGNFDQVEERLRGLGYVE